MDHNMNTGLLTTPIAVLPENKQRIVAYGINLFEVRKNKRQYINIPDFGYYDVRVSEGIYEYTMTYRYDARWYKGTRAYVDYTPDKKGILTGYIPDDEEYHNRIMLASNINSGTFRILRYHTQSGFLPEKRIVQEIMFIRDLIHTWNVDLIEGKKRTRIFVDPDENKCREFAREQEKDGKKVNVIYGKIKPIKVLIDKYGQKWLFSPEFQAEIIPDIKEKVAERFASDSTQPSGINLEDQIASVLQSMGPEKIAELMNKKTGNPSNAGKPLEELSINTLRSLGKTKGLNITPDMKKDDIISAIREDVNLNDSNHELKEQPDQITNGEDVSFG